jgi:TIGR03009 family protein
MPTLGLTLAAILFAPQLAVHLAAWEKQAHGVTSFQADFTLTRKDPVFRKESRYSGSVLGLSAGSARVRLTNDADPNDYEAYICDGRSLYAYSGLTKTVTEFRLPPPGLPPKAPGGLFERIARGLCLPEWFAVRLVSGATAKEAAKRFDVSLVKEDEHYVYLDLRPRSSADRLDMERARVALHGPGVKPPRVPYSPAEVLVVMKNGDTEHWRFTDVKVNLPEVDEKAFQYVEVPGFILKKAPAPGGEGPRRP